MVSSEDTIPPAGRRTPARRGWGVPSGPWRQRGQALPLLALMMVTLIGMMVWHWWILRSAPADA